MECSAKDCGCNYLVGDRRSSTRAVRSSAAKNDSIASSETVTSVAVPNVVAAPLEAGDQERDGAVLGDEPPVAVDDDRRVGLVPAQHAVDRVADRAHLGLVEVA